MKDYLVQALAYNGQVRAYVAKTTEMVEVAKKLHDTWKTASAALGRTMTFGAMLGAMQKGATSVTVKVEGDGDLGVMLVHADNKGKVRGYVKNPHVNYEANEKGKLDVKRAVGTKGLVTVVKEIPMGNNFSGQVPLISGELGEDFTYYFAVSEQIPSSVGVGVLVNPDESIRASGGFIIQMMPNAKESVVSELEAILGIFPPPSHLIDQGLTPEEILEQLFGENNFKLLDKIPLEFRCSCSKERSGKVIASLGRTEMLKWIAEDGQAEVVCEFCRQAYHFSADELETLAEKARN